MPVIDVSMHTLESVISKAMSTGADYAEVYLEKTNAKNITVMNGQVYGVADSIICGASVRIYKGLRSVFASTSDTSESGLLDCAQRVASALGEGSAPIHIVLKERLFGDAHPIKIVPASVSNKEKIDVIKQACAGAAEYHSSITQTRGSFDDYDHCITIANSDGLLADDRQIRSRLRVGCVASDGNENQSGGAMLGNRFGFELFEGVDVKKYGTDAATQAVTMLSAGYCPSGKMPVAIGNGFGGVIFHEACGHSLEASSVAYNRSEFAGKLGQLVANPKVTAIDDGTMINYWGSINIDDEGTPAQRNVLIENGVLKTYMIDRFNGRRMGMPSTGSSRRQSYSFEPTSRMTNTYIAPGTDSADDIIGSIDYGVYAKKMGGGSVNPATGEFNFGVDEAYMIRDGKICEPVRGVSLVGRGSEVIQKIDMVSDNLELSTGMCGSSSGSIPTSVGQPMIRVSDITVGGRG